MKNCTGERCIMQFDKVDPATCQCAQNCPQATPPKTHGDILRAMNDDGLATFLALVAINVKLGLYEDFQPTSIEHWMYWLQQVDGE